ncbi:MAG: hypothetical protein K6B72_08635 [Lachnospiraceae bacterium]|nr:hypothetical protein [Lachnospiraceae bacterium]
MNTKQEKIERIKKSCRVGKIICRILMILCMVGTVACIAGAILVAVGGDQLARTGHTSLISNNGESMSIDELNAAINAELEQNALEERISIAGLSALIPRDMSAFVKLSIICGAGAVITALFVLAFWLFGQVFDIVLKEESPFTEIVMKKFRFNFILLSVLIAISLGLGAGLIVGFFFWCIYNIFDYGCVLQAESDETL